MKRFWNTRVSALLLAVILTLGAVPAALAAGADVAYEVSAGETVELKPSAFKKLYEKEYSDFCALRFTDTDDFDDYGRFYAKDIDGKKTYLKEKDMDDAFFYYDTEDMEDEDTDFALSGLTFDADDDAKSAALTLKFTLYGDRWNSRVTGTMTLDIDRGGSTDAELVWEMDEDEELTFDRKEFRNLFEEEYRNFSYLTFTGADGLDEAGMLVAYDPDEGKTFRVWEKDVEDYDFYYTSTDGEYLISSLTFCAGADADGKEVTLDFTLHGKTKSQTVDGTLVIQIGDVKKPAKKSDIQYTTQQEEQAFVPRDFNNFYQKSYTGDMLYVRFTGSENLKESTGKLYYRYDSRNEESFSASELKDCYFYYDEDDLPEDSEDCYPLEDLSFVPAKNFTGTVTLDFTAYRSSSKKVAGKVSITVEKAAATAVSASSVRYCTTSGSAVQISGNDLARAFAKQNPGSALQSIELLNVPSTGGLYYDYYTGGRIQFTGINGAGQTFYLSPTGTQRDVNKLTYVPSGTNYCDDLLFTAKGTGNRTMLGAITFSVSKALVAEIYGATPKNTAVGFPAASFNSAIYTATGKALSAIRLLELPAATVGSVTLGTAKADTATRYTYSTGEKRISDLRFTPASGYTGSVEIPYIAYDGDGSAIAVGKFCLGVVSKVKSFTDVPSSSWCYKYVTELSDAGVIDGYADSSFKEKNAITYGAALKLIMLAAGYPEQSPTVSGSPFSGYLDKARAEGIITRSNVDLTKPITRLQVAQLAAGAMKLTDSAGAKHFTDTDSTSVLALNAAGIVEGYFSGGAYTFKPSATLTRGQVSAIVWRMRNYQK